MKFSLRSFAIILAALLGAGVFVGQEAYAQYDDFDIISFDGLTVPEPAPNYVVDWNNDAVRNDWNQMNPTQMYIPPTVAPEPSNYVEYSPTYTVPTPAITGTAYSPAPISPAVTAPVVSPDLGTDYLSANAGFSTQPALVPANYVDQNAPLVSSASMSMAQIVPVETPGFNPGMQYYDMAPMPDAVDTANIVSNSVVYGPSLPQAEFYSTPVDTGYTSYADDVSQGFTANVEPAQPMPAYQPVLEPVRNDYKRERNDYKGNS